MEELLPAFISRKGKYILTKRGTREEDEVKSEIRPLPNHSPSPHKLQEAPAFPYNRMAVRTHVANRSYTSLTWGFRFARTLCAISMDPGGDLRTFKPHLSSACPLRTVGQPERWVNLARGIDHCLGYFELWLCHASAGDK